jgi:nicotinic acid mononucleotide adenylyltransferase
MNLPDAAWRQLIASVHASGPKAALAITGGGSGAIGALLRVPGGSRLLVEAQVPYDENALAQYLGFAPTQASSADTAIALAHAARRRVAHLLPAATDIVGLGATAALVSDRPRRGEHRYHIAFANAAGTGHCSAVLAKGRRDRAGEEDLVSRAIILFLARACGVEAPSPSSLLDADETYSETITTTADIIARLLAGEFQRVTVLPDGQTVLAAPPPPLVLPGSFNPLHEGHLSLARVAEDMLHQTASFEISVTNVDKPPLENQTIRNRIGQFAWKAPVEITRAPTFLEKSRVFGKTTFVIGADTAERLVAVRYYDNDPDRMDAALTEMGNAGAHFLVAVRVDAAGRLHSLRDAQIPERFADMFTEIPAERFRLDISSTAIRTKS